MKVKLLLFVGFLLCLGSTSRASDPNGAGQPSNSGATTTFPRFVRISGNLGVQGKSDAIGVVFALYKEESGGSPLWLEVQNVNPDSSGHYSVLLGSSQPEGLPGDLFSSNEARWLGVKPAGQDELPRVLLVSVPYALKAGDADTIGGLPPSAFVQANISGANSLAMANSRNAGPTPLLLNTGTSAGAANQIAKWVDPSTLGNSLLFDNGTNVGINTLNPQSTLDVNGEAIFRSFSTLYTTTNTFGPVFQFTNAAKPTAASWTFGVPGYANATAFFIYDYANQNAPFTLEQGSGANSLYFKKGGNVGVGTSGPTSKLTVTGTIESTSGGIKFPDGSVLTSAVAPVVTTSVTYSGTTADQVFRAVQNQAGAGSFSETGVPAGLRGDSTTNTGFAAGVLGTANSYQAPGVAGLNLSSCNPADLTHCNAYGVYGWSPSASRGVGVAGQVDALTGDNVGVYGLASGDAGTGVYGYANSLAAASDATGVYGQTDAPNGTGVWGSATAANGNTIGVYGSVASPTLPASGSTGSIAGLFDAPTGGTILVGRSGTASYAPVFRVDSTGLGYFDGGTQTGGADFAESVDAMGGSAQYSPGDLMMIDTTGTRRIALANRAYSTKVAGIYSFKPGVLATPHKMNDPRISKEVPLAIVGIVPCKVTAANGSIRAGDLLVASNRPGYAMKGTDRRRMLGAIVGKALGSLDRGTGTIEVLVSLH